MWGYAKHYVNRGRAGPAVAAVILSGFAYVIIWAVIEPLGIPEVFPSVRRWVIHALAAAFGGTALTVALMVAIREAKPDSAVRFEHGYDAESHSLL